MNKFALSRNLSNIIKRPGTTNHLKCKIILHYFNMLRIKNKKRFNLILFPDAVNLMQILIKNVMFFCSFLSPLLVVYIDLIHPQSKKVVIDAKN